ncbi:protein translocase subunit SecD [Tsukamurella sp. 8F]|uniref:protein translocase subunit SecD n=1 Tax=unclassified Tsukamurella TaxID=2633480 RepID=UPI0023B97BC5|nr:MULTISPECIES: protein translocase subunit SecD [unclassified Tsukamurella]MDF0529150.1 protein translocase subunit SecD [Tsukamurella sp. 8J]MDF0585335.1 protein translocase subunit SecD [Tsukamurella sp. 8F]
MDISPKRLLLAFGVFVVAIYALVFLTGDKKPVPKLGIDLQGGTTVTLQAITPDGKAPDKTSLERAQEIIDKRVNGLGVSGSTVQINGSNLVITVPGQDGDQARALGQTARLYVRPVVATEAAQVPAPGAKTPEAPDMTDPAVAKKAIADAKATRQSADQATQQKAMKALNCSLPDPLAGNDDPKLPLVACGQDHTAVYTLGPSIIDGQQITEASAGFDQQGGQYVVQLKYDGNATKVWADYTAKNVGKGAAFVLDSQVVSAPTINGPIPGGETQVTGQFSQSEANDLANVLKYGSLPLSFKPGTAQTISATLGFASLKAGLLAGLIGLVLVLVYALLYYRALGILTALSLLLSVALIYGLLVLLGRWIGYSLDLSGIAGIIIGIGMTADSFVVYFERIKDEIREGRTFRSAVPRGWARARRTIWTGNAVSFLAAAVLYVLAIGEVKGFAFTLGLSTILDIVIVFLVTHPLVHYASRTEMFSKPSMNGLGAMQRVAHEHRVATASASTGAVSSGAGSSVTTDKEV